MSFIASTAIALSIALSTGTAYAAEQTHTVTDKDTFWKLSLQYQVPLHAMLDANVSIDPLNLQEGMKVVIPSSSAADAGNKNSAVSAKASSAAEPISTATSMSAAQLKYSNIKGPGGYDYLYSKQLHLSATAYTAAASENGKWGAVDYFGNKLKVGTVAVDPKLIPLGTKLFITGYDYDGLPKIGIIATATDTGGAIKGNRIDMFVPGHTAQAKNFGIQRVTAYVLK